MNKSVLYMTVVSVIGLVCGTITCVCNPGQATLIGPMIFAALAGVLAILQKASDTGKKIDNVHDMVNSQREGMVDKIEFLQAELAKVRQAQAIERAAVAEMIRVAIVSEREAVRTATLAEKQAQADRTTNSQ